MSSKGSIGGRYEDEFAPKDSKSCGVRVSDHIFLGMSTELFIRPGMIVPGDAAATVRNIAASEALFRLSLVSDLIRQVLLMLLTLILYKLLKPVNKTIAALMVIFYLVCVPLSMLNELNHFAVLMLSSGAGYLTADVTHRPEGFDRQNRVFQGSLRDVLRKVS